MSQPPFVSGAVEGLLDEVVLSRIGTEIGAQVQPIHTTFGKPALLARLEGYNRAARHSPWVVLVDLDLSADCAPPARLLWLPNPSSKMCFRVAVRAIEAWLLADIDGVADFLRVPVNRLPLNPEALPNPKLTLATLAAGSRSRVIRNGLGPRPHGGHGVGPEYTGLLTEFISRQWRPTVAAQRSASLASCLKRLTELTGN